MPFRAVSAARFLVRTGCPPILWAFFFSWAGGTPIVAHHHCTASLCGPCNTSKQPTRSIECLLVAAASFVPEKMSRTALRCVRELRLADSIYQEPGHACLCTSFVIVVIILDALQFVNKPTQWLSIWIPATEGECFYSSICLPSMIKEVCFDLRLVYFSVD